MFLYEHKHIGRLSNVRKCTFNNEIVDHITNIDLKSLCLRNLNETGVAYLNINSSRNSFVWSSCSSSKSKHGYTNDIRNKTDEGFPPGQLLLDDYVSFSVLIGMGMVVVFWDISGEIYHPNFYQWIKT